jgi:hypothetical protein
MPVYVTSPDFTIEEGTGVELYGSLETSIYADKVRFYHNGNQSENKIQTFRVKASKQGCFDSRKFGFLSVRN